MPLTAVQGQTSTEIGKRLGLSPINVRVTRNPTAQKFRQFVAGQPALADAFGVSPPQIRSTKTVENPHPGESSKYSENSFAPL